MGSIPTASTKLKKGIAIIPFFNFYGVESNGSRAPSGCEEEDERERGRKRDRPEPERQDGSRGAKADSRLRR